jgi:hypothetical protein
MATLLELSATLGDFANATTVLMQESEQLLGEFQFVSSNKFMGYEMPITGTRTLTGDGTRQINQGYNTVQVTGDGLVTFPTFLYGGAQADEALLRDYKPEMQQRKREDIIRKSGQMFIDDIFHTGSEPKSTANFTSLKQFATANGRSENMATNGGALSLKRLAAALNNVPSNGADVRIYMSTMMKPLISELSYNQVLSGNVAIVPNQFGMPFFYFMGYPITFVGRRFDFGMRMAFNETTGSNNETTSIFIVCQSTRDVFGIFDTPKIYTSETVSIVTTPDGKRAPQYQELIDIPMGIGYGSPYCVWRLGGITNAEIVK